MKVIPLIGRSIRIGRRLHVNQPLQLDVDWRGSVSSSVYRYALAIISANILHKCDKTSLTVTRIAVSLTFKWEVALSDDF